MTVIVDVIAKLAISVLIYKGNFNSIGYFWKESIIQYSTPFPPDKCM